MSARPMVIYGAIIYTNIKIYKSILILLIFDKCVVSIRLSVHLCYCMNPVPFKLLDLISGHYKSLHFNLLLTKNTNLVTMHAHHMPQSLLPFRVVTDV